MKSKINKKITISLVAIFLLLIALTGLTYAYFSSTSSTSTQTITSGNLTMTFTQGQILRANNIVPLQNDEFLEKATTLPITIENTGDFDINTKITLSEISIPNKLKNHEFKWGLFMRGTAQAVASGDFNDIGNSTTMTLIENIPLYTPETSLYLSSRKKNYDLKIWIQNIDSPQNDMQAQTFSAKVNISSVALAYTDESCFTMNEDYGAIIAYSDTCPRDVVIPRTINGVEVKLIGSGTSDSAPFFNKRVTSVIMPDSVESIENEAFRNDDAIVGLLKNIILPESINYMGMEAFYNNDLNGIEYLNDNLNYSAFESNKLMSVEINTDIIDSRAFDYNKLIYVKLLDTTYIESDAFQGSKLTSITLPNTLQKIDNCAFESNDLKNIIIPRNVIYIGESAFRSNNKLSSIKLQGKSSLEDFGEYIEGTSGLAPDWNLIDIDNNTYAEVIFES